VIGSYEVLQSCEGLHTTTELHTCRANPHNSFIFSVSVLCWFYQIPVSDFVFVSANKASM